MSEEDINWDEIDSKASIKGNIWKEDGKVYDFSEILYEEGLTGDQDE